MRAEYYAHSLPGQPIEKWERLEDHLQAVASRARDFAVKLGAPDWGYLAGLWHDVGKYQEVFQRRLRGEQIHAPHAGAGAALSSLREDPVVLLAAFAIAGHHAGLANWSCTLEGGPKPLLHVLLEHREMLSQFIDSVPPSIRDHVHPALPEAFSVSPRFGLAKPTNRPLTYFTRMLFSALVDADRLATAQFYAASEGRRAPADQLQYASIADLCDRLDSYIDAKAEGAAPSAMNDLRQEVLTACRHASSSRRGLFSLTVPTGGGKTLSAMSFGLRHAVKHSFDRVIVVIPFTSIIEQNARQYRIALGAGGNPDDSNVLEHHSGIDEQARERADSEAERRRQTAAENWDAPIVVTTTVQFFESLFSNHPSRCRKLHRIANSVVILDEVQTLPPQFLMAIVEGLRELTTRYGCSIVLSTATPPALEKSDILRDGLTDVEPIISADQKLFDQPAARRVAVEWRTDDVVPYVNLAGDISQHQKVLAIVHRRADARRLWELLPSEGRFHLSALMCPAHRLARIAEINAALRAEGMICRVVATQLIEAGVDVDFPVVYRALAGLDSIAQSAGRCDREGRLSEMAGHPAGRFVVFRAETAPPSLTLRKALGATERLLNAQHTEPALAGGLDPFNPEHGRLFFREFYAREQLDAANILRELNEFNFANVAEAFRLIDDRNSVSIVAPWGEGLDRAAAYQDTPSRATQRALQPFLVQVRREYAQQLADLGAIELFEDRIGLPTALFGSRYSEEFGMEIDPTNVIEAEVLVV